ncbi:LOW QUALITY PROTEIN: uncharacterized protein RB166_018650 [Leptodactylus fuscus]
MWRNICLLLAGVLHVLGSGGPLDLFHSRWMTHPERDDSVFLLWGYDREVQEMSLEIQTPLSSAIVLGLGPDKSLNKTDFVVAGWNEHGETYFYDAHTEGSWPPVKDKSQDYELLNLSRNKTHTVMKVWRQWFTCDRHDHEIENDTVRVMVVIGSGEPLELTDDNTFRKSIFFLEVPDDVTVPEILLTHEFRMNNYEVIEDPDTIGIVHHILIYMCGKHTVPITEVGDCYGSDIRFFQCTTATFGWAVGGEPFNYPAQTGVSIGAEGDPQYVRIEIHYSNFELKEGLMDSSGIRIYYTPEIRPYDSETLGVGIFTLPLHFIPPGSKEFRSYGLCNTSLMEEISDEPIPDLKVTSYLLHGHLTARGVRTLHYRNGTLIGSLGEDKTYDFNFQQVRSLPKEVTIKMGDQIVVECLSSTMDKEDITFGGTSTLNEMCITFLFYYPASSISLCVSYTDIFHVTDALGMEREDRTLCLIQHDLISATLCLTQRDLVSYPTTLCLTQRDPVCVLSNVTLCFTQRDPVSYPTGPCVLPNGTLSVSYPIIIEAVLNMDTVEWNDETRATAQKAVMEANQLAMVWDMEGRRLNRTCPLPPISLPPPYHCEGDSLDLYIWDVYKEILEVTCMENKFIPYSYGTLDFQMLLDIVYDTSEEGMKEQCRKTHWRNLRERHRPLLMNGPTKESPPCPAPTHPELLTMENREASMWRNICLLLAGVLHVLGSRGPLDVSHSRWMTHPERDDSVFLLWGYDREVQEIALEIQTPLSSSIVLGLGPGTSLNKTDFVVAGWNEHGETYFYDAHIEGDWPPVKDKSQDYELLNLSRNKTHTVMTVWRPWFTCDRHDHEIENDTVRVMVVIGDGEPLEITEDNTFKSIFFLEVLEDVMLPEKTFIHDFKLNDFLVPDQDTTYACTFLPMPRVSKKHHIIRFDPIKDPDTIGIVHHILIYICPNNTDIATETGDCYGGDSRYTQCMTTTFGWAVGGEPFDYPSEVGFSIGTEGDPQYIRIEIHYSNFENKEGLRDSSGIRIYYTPELRPNDCAIFMVGIFTFPIHFIPPASEEFRNYGLCNTRLMEDLLGEPIPDLTVTTFLLHGHLSVRGVRIMHYRNGTLIGSLGEDKKYDFNFQQFRNLPREVTIKMGDQIVVECTSNTMDREGVTFGGPSSLNEMCVGCLIYYPVHPIAFCFSLMDIHHVTDALGLERGDSVMDAILNIDSLEWDEEKKVIAQKAIMTANYVAMVQDRKGTQNYDEGVAGTPSYHKDDVIALRALRGFHVSVEQNRLRDKSVSLTSLEVTGVWTDLEKDNTGMNDFNTGGHKISSCKECDCDLAQGVDGTSRRSQTWRPTKTLCKDFTPLSDISCTDTMVPYVLDGP